MMSLASGMRVVYKCVTFSILLWVIGQSSAFAPRHDHTRTTTRLLKRKGPTTHQPTQCTLILLSEKNSQCFEVSDFSIHYDELSPDAIEAAKRYVSATRTRRRMVVFDKDGTIGNDKDSLRRWVAYMTEKLNGYLSGSVSEKKILVEEFYALIGWDSKSNDVFPSAPLAAGTWPEQVSTLFQFLKRNQEQIQDSFELTRESIQGWHDDLGSLHGQDTPLIKDTRGMLQKCKDFGYTVAICTSDDRPATDAAMKYWNICDLIDFSICANEVKEGKPSATPLIDLCKLASADQSSSFAIIPEDCVVVGDTTSDTGMANNANAGFCVGVLTGSGSSEQLQDTGANVVFPSIAYVPALLTIFREIEAES